MVVQYIVLVNKLLIKKGGRVTEIHELEGAKKHRTYQHEGRKRTDAPVKGGEGGAQKISYCGGIKGWKDIHTCDTKARSRECTRNKCTLLKFKLLG